MTTRKKKLKPRFTTARNDRKTVYHYFPQDEVKSTAVRGGRCNTCRHITALGCSTCNTYFCEKHLKNHRCNSRIDYAL